MTPALAASLAASLAGDIGVGGRGFVVLAVLCGAAAIFLLLYLVMSGRSVETDLETRLSAYSEQEEATGWLGRFRLLRRFAVSAERMAERRGFLAQIETALEQANLTLRPGEAMAGLLVLAVVAGLAALVLTGSPLSALLLAVAAVILAAYLVAAAASRQRRRFEEQLPDTLALLATSLRAGYSMLQALDTVAQEAADPTAREFQRVLNEIRLGRSVAESLQDSATRMDSVDFDWVVLAFTIQREVGGNLAEVLDTAGDTMLARTRLRREMRALTSEGRISALVLGSMPFLVAGFLLVTNPGYIAPLLESSLGVTALVIAGLLLILGLVWMARIVKPEI
ncbi:MAG: type II secretion system F family protein [Acidimicrobiia bacterium]|nr:type II secretion system F family protein [Acidimicrobiia bacterium]